jgi:hypothetical protein
VENLFYSPIPIPLIAIFAMSGLPKKGKRSASRRFEIEHLIAWFKSKKKLTLTLLITLFGISISTTSLVIPFFVLLLGTGYQSLALLFALTSTPGLLVIYLARVADIKGKRSMLVQCFLIASFSLLLMAMI